MNILANVTSIKVVDNGFVVAATHKSLIIDDHNSMVEGSTVYCTQKNEKLLEIAIEECKQKAYQQKTQRKKRGSKA